MRACSPGASTAWSGACSGATRPPPSSTSCCRWCSSPARGDRSRQPAQLDRLVPDDRGHERDVHHVHRARLQHRVPARARRAQAHPRHAAADVSYFGGVAANAVTNTALQIAIVVLAGACLLRDRLAGALGRAGRVRARRRRLLRRARRRLRPRDPQLRVHRRLRQRRVPARSSSISFYVFDSTSAPGFVRTIAEALPLKPLIDGLSGAMVTGSEPREQPRRARRDRAVGRLRAVLRRARLLMGAVAHVTAPHTHVARPIGSRP